MLASHPTPPAFDGPEDRNGLRNHDEIRLWVDYLDRGAGAYIRDDQGRRGGFKGRDFIVMGDQNSDPADGASLHDAIRGLLAHPRVNSALHAASEGGAEASAPQGGANATHTGDPRFDTSDFNDRVAGNLRVDYLLPSKGLTVCGGGVYWPRQDRPGRAAGLGRPPRAELGSPAGVARRHFRPSSMPTGQWSDSQRAFASWSLNTTRTNDFFSTLFARSRPSRMVSMYSRYSLSRVQGSELLAP